MELDCRHLLCPMPVIRVQNAMHKLESGETLVVTCTDPGTKHDIPTWCRINQHHVDTIDEANGEMVYTLRKG